MPQYRNNQFVSDWLKPQRDEWQNAPFQYPRRVVRNSTISELGNRVTTATELDRGFMRNLMTETVSAGGLINKQQRQRFNFQFNPSAIQQEVQMRQDIYLPILQQPEQFAQPMSAVASFNFDLLLDRTMEVGSSLGQTSPEERRLVPSTDVFGDTNPVNDVYQIGVLSDLQVLYSIIGQGFSNQFIESQLEQLKIQARLDAADNEENTLTEADIDAITSDKFQANFGNNAFLIPMPVRVVFSELFMVDGFVTSTSVRFTKFNTNMVPIQASVGLGMNALYIGFAKQKTFLTVQLENAKNIQLSNLQTSIAQQSELNELARQSANKFVFYSDKAEEWIDMFDPSKDNPVPLANLLKYSPSIEEDYNFQRQFKVGFKDAKILGDNDPIETYFEGGGTAPFSYNWRFLVYGPYNTKANADYDKARVGSQDTSTFTSNYSGVVKRAEYFSSSNPTATDKESWLRIRSDSIRDNDDEAKPIAGSPLFEEPSEYNSKYFLVHLYGTVTAGTQTLPFNEWKVVQGSAQYKTTISLNWPRTTGIGGNTSGVSGSGYANDRLNLTQDGGPQ